MGNLDTFDHDQLVSIIKWLAAELAMSAGMGGVNEYDAQFFILRAIAATAST
jgi:hypothetical protein